MELFESAQLGPLTLKNRVVMPPMDMYAAGPDATVTPFHINHYGARVVGGVGLVITEVVAVSPEGRITEQDLGLWRDDQLAGHQTLVQHVHDLGGVIAMQIGHAGRKCDIKGVRHIAPSAIDFNPKAFDCPHEMSEADIKAAVAAFQETARRADQAGYDGLEIHAAHGYLIHEFLSPLSNTRTDSYGGDTAGRTRFLSEIIDAIRVVWPKEKALWMRVSASDYHAGGLDIDEMVRIVDLVKDRLDAVHVSSGGLVDVPIKLYAGYQVHFAEVLKQSSGLPVIAVGLIEDVRLAENILMDGRADFIALGRPLLRQPYWCLNAAQQKQRRDLIPASYHRGF